MSTYKSNQIKNKSDNDVYEKLYEDRLLHGGPLPPFIEQQSQEFKDKFKTDFIPDPYNIVNIKNNTTPDKKIDTNDIIKCILDIVKEDTNLKFNIIEEYSNLHYKYISRSINNYIAMTPDDLNECFSNVPKLKYLCDGKFIDIIFNYIKLRYENFNKIKKQNIFISDKLFLEKKNKVLDIFDNNIVFIIKKTIDISKMIDNNICNKISSTTSISEIILNSIIKKSNKYNDINTNNYNDYINNNVLNIILLSIIIYLLYRLYLILH